MTHTKGPWKAEESYDHFISGTMHTIIEICAPLSDGVGRDEFEYEGVCVVITPHVHGYKKELKTRKANAEFIVRACNSHDDLLEALEENNRLLKRYVSKDTWRQDDLESVQKSNAAIAKGRGTS